MGRNLGHCQKTKMGFTCVADSDSVLPVLLGSARVAMQNFLETLDKHVLQGMHVLSHSSTLNC